MGAETELPPLADIKRTLDASPERLGFHATCGLFAAIATAPEMVPPSTWIDMVKGERPFENKLDAQAFIHGLMALYSEVLRSLADHDAHCCPDPSDQEAVREFCSAYLGIALRDASWGEDARSYAMLLPVLALSGAASNEKLGQLLPSFAQAPEGWLGRAREGLSETVSDLYAYWAEGRRATAQELSQRAKPVQRDAAEVGRNDPCPCGSGKKSKKCCAN